MSKSFEHRLFNTKMRPSSFKFEWAVVRGQYIDKAADSNENVKALTNKLVEGSLSEDECKTCAKNMLRILDNYKKPSYYYRLFRKHVDNEALVKVIQSKFNLRSHEYRDFMKNNTNIKTYREVCAVEDAKRRIFNSLKKMQEYADKHSLGIDVYELYRLNK